MRRTVFVSKTSCRTTSGLLCESFKRENSQPASMGAALVHFRGGVEDTCAEQMHRRKMPTQIIMLRRVLMPPNVPATAAGKESSVNGASELPPRSGRRIRALVRWCPLLRQLWSSFLWWLNHNRLELVLEDDHSTIAELYALAGRSGSLCIGRGSAGEPVNVLVVATLDK